MPPKRKKTPKKTPLTQRQSVTININTSKTKPKRKKSKKRLPTSSRLPPASYAPIAPPFVQSIQGFDTMTPLLYSILQNQQNQQRMSLTDMMSVPTQKMITEKGEPQPPPPKINTITPQIDEKELKSSSASIPKSLSDFSSTQMVGEAMGDFMDERAPKKELSGEEVYELYREFLPKGFAPPNKERFVEKIVKKSPRKPDQPRITNTDFNLTSSEEEEEEYEPIMPSKKKVEGFQPRNYDPKLEQARMGVEDDLSRASSAFLKQQIGQEQTRMGVEDDLSRASSTFLKQQMGQEQTRMGVEDNLARATRTFLKEQMGREQTQMGVEDDLSRASSAFLKQQMGQEQSRMGVEDDLSRASRKFLNEQMGQEQSRMGVEDVMSERRRTFLQKELEKYPKEQAFLDLENIGRTAKEQQQAFVDLENIGRTAIKQAKEQAKAKRPEPVRPKGWAPPRVPPPREKIKSKKEKAEATPAVEPIPPPPAVEPSLPPKPVIEPKPVVNILQNPILSNPETAPPKPVVEERPPVNILREPQLSMPLDFRGKQIQAKVNQKKQVVSPFPFDESLIDKARKQREQRNQIQISVIEDLKRQRAQEEEEDRKELERQRRLQQNRAEEEEPQKPKPKTKKGLNIFGSKNK